LNINSFENIDVLISFSKKIALWSFFIGTLILLLYYFTLLGVFIYLGLFFSITAIFLNGFFFINLLLLVKGNKEKRSSIFQAVLLMLANIPIGILYIYLGFEIFSSHYSD